MFRCETPEKGRIPGNFFNIGKFFTFNGQF